MRLLTFFCSELPRARITEKPIPAPPAYEHRAKIRPGRGDRKNRHYDKSHPHSYERPNSGCIHQPGKRKRQGRCSDSETMSTDKNKPLVCSNQYQLSEWTKERKVSFLSNSSRNSLCRESRSVSSSEMPAPLKISQILSSGMIGAFLPEWPTPLMWQR